MKRAIVALTLVIIVLTVFLRGYYRVEMLRADYEGVRDTLKLIAKVRYAPLDSLVRYYRSRFSEEPQTIQEINRYLSEFNRGNLKSIEKLENYIYNIQNSLKDINVNDKRTDSIRIFLSRLEKTQELLEKVLKRYNSTVIRIKEMYSKPLYKPFARFMIGKKPQIILIKYEPMDLGFLLKAPSEKEIPIEVLNSVFIQTTNDGNYIIETIFFSPESIHVDTLKRDEGEDHIFLLEPTHVDTLKKEEGEGDKSDQAGVSTPGE